MDITGLKAFSCCIAPSQYGLEQASYGELSRTDIEEKTWNQYTGR